MSARGPEATRRDFLKVVGLAGGTFALGLELPGCSPKMPMAAGGDFAPNAWIRITQTNRFLFALDRVEMGQGTTTSHATLVAEELDVDPSRIEVVAAPADRAYDNPELGFQATGGSTSLKSSFMPLRRAGATTREMLRRAASVAFGAPLAECVAADGEVRHVPSGRKKTYGEVAQLASTLPIPENVALKDPATFRFVGKRVNRLDARAKVDGSAVYGIDVKVPHALVAIVIRSPTIGGKLVSFDPGAAKTRPGVVDVVRVPSGVAIVAESYYRARAAEKDVTCVWDAGATMSTDVLRRAYAERLERSADVVASHGSIGSGMAKARHVLEARYEAPYLAHATLEPQNTTVHLRENDCDIWAPTQAPALTTEAARRILGFSRANIHVHTTCIGGGFGRRLAQDFVVEAVHVALAIRALGRPVKVVWSREDDTTNDPYRPMSLHSVKGGVGDDGKISAWSQRVVTQSIVGQVGREWAPVLLPNGAPGILKLAIGHTAGALFGTNATTDPSSHEGVSDMTYEAAFGAFRVEYAPVESGVPVGFWRSVGHSENAFIVESFIDELAHAAGRDPLEFRLAHLAKGSRARAVLELAAEKIGWKTPPPTGIFRGIGLTHAFSTFCAEIAEIAVDGHAVSVKRVVAAVDCGAVVNPDIVTAQIEGGICFGLGAALKQAITIEHGRVKETNFHQFPLLRMHEMPKVEVFIVPSKEGPTGVGEPGVPPIAPAVANAIFAATGVRLRRLPLLPALAEALAARSGGAKERQ